MDTIIESITNNIKNKLKNYYYDKIYSWKGKIFRHNIKLVPITKSVSNYLYKDYIAKDLPLANVLFSVFICNKSSIHFILPNGYLDRWVNMIELVNNNKTFFRLITEDGLCIPYNACYVYFDSDPTVHIVYIAIRNDVLYDLIKNTTNNRLEDIDVFLMISQDTTLENNKTVYSSIPYLPYDNNTNYAKNVLISRALNTYNNNKRSLLLFVNGYFYYVNQPEQISSLINNNNIIEVVIDENIYYTYYMDPSFKRSFTIDELSKEFVLIHLPKDFYLNNKKFVYFNNIYIFGFDPDTKKGLLMPYIEQNYGIIQLSHQDFGLDRLLVDETKNFLGCDDIDFYIVLVDTGIQNTVVSNEDFTYTLYKEFSDNEIVDILSGNYDDQLEFLFGKNLYKTVFTNSLWNDQIVKEDPLNITKILGPYETLNILQQNKYFTNISSPTNVFYVNKPEVYYNIPILPLVYRNGIKLEQNKIEVEDQPTFIKITSSVDFLEGDELAIRLKPFGNYDLVKFVPNTDNNSIEKPFEVIDVYYEEPISIIGLFGEINKKYVKAEENIDYIVDNDKIYFNNTLYGKQIYIIPRYYTTTIIKNFNVTNEPLIYELTYDGILYLNAKSIEVYLNGKKLIEKLEYDITWLYDQSDQNENYANITLIIQGIDNLKTENNILEIIISSTEEFDPEYGFSIKDNNNTYNILPTKKYYIWLYNNLCNLFVDGKITDISKLNINITPGQPFDIGLFGTLYKNGTGYEFVNNIHKVLYDIIEPYIDQQFFENYNKLFEYIVNKNQPFTYPDPLIIETYKHIYSLYTDKIINHILENIDPSDIPNPITDEYINQLLSMFLKYKSYDIIFKYQNKIDFRFVNIVPCIIYNLSTESLIKYELIRKIIYGALKDIDVYYDYTVVYNY